MNALDIVAKHIREATQQLATRFSAEIKSLRDEVGQRFGLEEKARGLAERKQEMELADVRKGIVGMEALSKSLAESAAALAEAKSSFEVRIKSAEDALATRLTEFEAKYQGQIAIITKGEAGVEQANAVNSKLSAEIKKCRDDCAADRAQLEVRLKAAEEAAVAREQKHVAELEALQKSFADRVAELSAILSELTAKHAKADQFSAAALEKQLAERDTKLAALEKRLAESGDAIQALTKSLDERSRSASEGVSALKSDIDAQRKSLDGSIATLRDGDSSAVARIDALEKSAAATAELMVSVEKTLKEIESIEIPEIPKDVTDLATKFASFEVHLAEIAERVTNCMHFDGQWDDRGEYKAGSAVAFKNSLWVATRDDDLGTPGDRDSGWKMCIKSGKLITPYDHR